MTELHLQLNDTILDIATGTADIAILIARKFMELYPATDPSDSLFTPIIGLDPSEAMLRIGHNKILNQQLQHHIELLLGDVQNMSQFESQYFSKVAMSFGLRNVQNRSLALHEIFRVFKANVPSQHPLPKLCILEFSRPSSGIIAHLAIAFIRYVLPTLGTLFTGNFHAYKHLSDSIMEFPLPSQLIDELQSVGFNNCQYVDIFQDIVYLYTCVGSFEMNETESGSDEYDFIAQSELNLNGL